MWNQTELKTYESVWISELTHTDSQWTDSKSDSHSRAERFCRLLPEAHATTGSPAPELYCASLTAEQTNWKAKTERELEPQKLSWFLDCICLICHSIKTACHCDERRCRSTAAFVLPSRFQTCKIEICTSGYKTKSHRGESATLPMLKLFMNMLRHLVLEKIDMHPSWKQSHNALCRDQRKMTDKAGEISNKYTCISFKTVY